jgi:hypothetical protein
VWRARTARDVRAIETDPEAAPVAAREFSRSERLLIRVPAYSVGDAPLTVSARLLNRTRQVMRDLPLDSTDSEQHRRQIQLSLAGLAPGEYSIEITASTRSGQANETLNFRVTS